MANLKVRNLASLKFGGTLFISVALASAMLAQAPPQLQVEVGPNQQVRILARDVSYGEVLRALRGKSGWEIEIPPLADELKLSYVQVETTQPEIALAKLLEGSRLGYAFLSRVNGSGGLKVLVIPPAPREPSLTQETASSPPTPDNIVTGASLPLAAQAPAVTTIEPNATTAETTPELPPAPSTMPLADAINAIGVPPGVSPADVGKAMRFPISDAANIMGVPPGVSPADVGKAMTFPISDAANIMGVPPGVSPADVGKTITMPLPTGPGKHP